MVMLWKIKEKVEKQRKNARNFDKYWSVLCAGGSKIWGCEGAKVGYIGLSKA